jgi:hypothetical protein
MAFRSIEGIRSLTPGYLDLRGVRKLISNPKKVHPIARHNEETALAMGRNNRVRFNSKCNASPDRFHFLPHANKRSNSVTAFAAHL